MTGVEGAVVVGVDVGGTFTDIFLFDEASGRYRVAKVPSTPADQAEGFIAGLTLAAGSVSGIGTVVHGTTVATNALLERKGAKTGVITTAGFRDVLEMRRRDRPRTWGLWGQFRPIVERALRLEVPERTLADGTIECPVDEAAVQEAARALLDGGAEALSIFFVNAYANDRNERLAYDAAREVWPNAFVNFSSQIVPEIREFERASTTALNGYVQPVIARYLTGLERKLAEQAFAGQILIVQSNGGVMALDTARRFPIRTALSGPAAGVIAGAYIATEAGYPNIITCDMGGTSFDVSLVIDGASTLHLQTEVDFGLVIRTPMIEIATIGAGGGSIAGVDRGGILQIGPDSAGSDPGPACYGLGNMRPTVTDANLILGRINPDRPLGGRAALDVEAAKTAVQTHVGDPLGLDVMAAAEAVIAVANARMAGAIRLVSIERGHDPRDFAVMPFGGAGALHVGALVREVGLARALIPRFPGVTSALGCVIADMRHDFVQTINRGLDDLDEAELNATMGDQARRGLELLSRSGVAFAARQVQFEFDMLYVGQTHTVAVPLEAGFDPNDIPLGRDDLVTAFEAAYRRAYGRLLKGIGMRVLNLRVAVIGRRPRFDLSALADAATASPAEAHLGSRPVWAGGQWHDCAIYDRLSLRPGSRLAGPALLEQDDTTIYVDPGMTAEVDRLGNLLVMEGEEG